MDEFPGNSHADKGTEPGTPQRKKKVEAVVTGETAIRKKPMGKRLAETFVPGNKKSIVTIVAASVLIPAAKEMFSEAATSFVDMMLYGESRNRRRSGGGAPDRYGRVDYAGMSSGGGRNDSSRAQISRRSARDFPEFILSSRVDADNVLDGMFDLLSKYNIVTLADVYDLCNETAAYTDDNYGWTDLRGADVQRVRGGYLLQLPRPVPLD